MVKQIKILENYEGRWVLLTRDSNSQDLRAETVSRRSLAAGSDKHSPVTNTHDRRTDGQTNGDCAHQRSTARPMYKSTAWSAYRSVSDGRIGWWNNKYTRMGCMMYLSPDGKRVDDGRRHESATIGWTDGRQRLMRTPRKNILQEKPAPFCARQLCRRDGRRQASPLSATTTLSDRPHFCSSITYTDPERDLAPKEIGESHDYCDTTFTMQIGRTWK